MKSLQAHCSICKRIGLRECVYGKNRGLLHESKLEKTINLSETRYSRAFSTNLNQSIRFEYSEPKQRTPVKNFTFRPPVKNPHLKSINNTWYPIHPKF